MREPKPNVNTHPCYSALYYIHMEQQPTQQPTPANQQSSPVFFAVISYIGFLCLVPYLTKHTDPDVQFHMKQGMALFAIEIVAMMLTWTIIFSWIGGPVSIVCLVASIYGVYNAYNGKRLEIPGLAPIISLLKL